MTNERSQPTNVGSNDQLGPLVERLSDLWHHADCRRAGELLKQQQLELEQLQFEVAVLRGERAVLVSLLRECDQVISTLEGDSTDEDAALRALLRTIKRITLLRQADERDLLSAHGA